MASTFVTRIVHIVALAFPLIKLLAKASSPGGVQSLEFFGTLGRDSKGSDTTHPNVLQGHDATLEAFTLKPYKGFPKIRGTLFGGPYNEDYIVLSSILGSSHFGKEYNPFYRNPLRTYPATPIRTLESTAYTWRPYLP